MVGEGIRGETHTLDHQFHIEHTLRHQFWCGEGGRERGRERGRMRERKCVFVCVRERQTERERLLIKVLLLELRIHN